MKKGKLLLLLSLLVLAALSRCLRAEEDTIIAVVNKEIITQKDLDGFANFTRMQLSSNYQGEELEKKLDSLKADLMQRLIEDRLILQEAKRADIKIDSDKVRQRIEEIKKAYPSDIEFQAALKRQGMSQGDIENKIREQLLMYAIIEAKIRRPIVINPTEVTAFYEANKDKMMTPEQREFLAVTTDNEDAAAKVFSALRNNEDIVGLAARYGVSSSELTASGRGHLKKEVEDVVFNLKAAEVSRPVRIEGKYYVFRLDRIVASRPETLTEAQGSIYNLLLEKRMQEKLASWVEELKNKAYIKVFKGNEAVVPQH